MKEEPEDMEATLYAVWQMFRELNARITLLEELVGAFEVRVAEMSERTDDGKVH